MQNLDKRKHLVNGLMTQVEIWMTLFKEYVTDHRHSLSPIFITYTVFLWTV